MKMQFVGAKTAAERKRNLTARTILDIIPQRSLDLVV